MTRFSQPNLIRADPATGKVQAVFPGGIILPVDPDQASLNLNPPLAIGDQQQVRWEQEEDGVLVATLVATDARNNPGADPTMYLSMAHRAGAGLVTTLHMGILPDPPITLGNTAPELRLTRSDTERIISCYANGSDQGTFRLLSNLNGECSFPIYWPNIAGGAQLRVDFIQVPVVFPGASLSNIVTVAHGLGVVPSGCVLTPQQVGGNHNAVFFRVGFTAFNITCGGQTVDGVAVGPGTVNGHGIVWGFG